MTLEEQRGLSDVLPVKPGARVDAVVVAHGGSDALVRRVAAPQDADPSVAAGDPCDP